MCTMKITMGHCWCEKRNDKYRPIKEHVIKCDRPPQTPLEGAYHMKHEHIQGICPKCNDRIVATWKKEADEAEEAAERLLELQRREQDAAAEAEQAEATGGGNLGIWNYGG
ncbi:hypothetical protein OCU04_000941 [Sclerotinia nivalis]|uniref:Uncharacterized protein n=1 Tax=Sclerotinia nivalis TaxID=352851 RepID=A0A9X0AX54_9HELO|nr:hypothetical protein OCU04_000941 [Sclerotinia nivalis]